jgi:hypothetical protein
LAESGIVKADVLIREAGTETWRPLSGRKEASAMPEALKPPRTPPPAQRPQPATSPGDRRYAEPSPPPGQRSSTSGHPDWLPLASLITGIVALISLGAPLLAVLLGVAALVAGILSRRTPDPKTRPLAIAGITTGALALVVTLGIVMSGPGGGTSGNREAAAIEKVLERGLRVERDAEKRFPGDTAAQARHYARELQRIDTRSCPTEFRVAHQDLVAAWETAIPYLASNTPLTLILEGLYGGLTNDYSTIGLSSHQAQLATQQIKNAYQSLHRIAVAYGARIPAP